MSFEVKLGELKRKLVSEICPVVEEVSRELDRFGYSLPLKEAQEIARSLSEVEKTIWQTHRALTGMLNPWRGLFRVDPTPSVRRIARTYTSGYGIYYNGILVGFVTRQGYTPSEVFYTLTPGGSVSNKRESTTTSKGFTKMDPVPRLRHLLLYWNAPRMVKYLRGLVEVEKKMREAGVQEDPRFLPGVSQ